MEKYPNLKMVAGMNEYSSVGAARAVKSAGAKDRITGGRDRQLSGSGPADGKWSLQRSCCSESI